MKLLLFFCLGASLLHLGVQRSSYLTTKVPRHLPPKSSLDYVIMKIEINYDSLAATNKAMDDPDAAVEAIDGLSIFLSKDRSPGNPDFQVIPMDFKNPNDYKTKLSDHVIEKSSGKIKYFFSEIKETTDAVIVRCADQWKVPVSDGTKYPVRLQGTYNAVIDKDLGFTMVEIPKDKYINALIILPDEGKEESVGAAANEENLVLWRNSMTRQVIDVEIPRATLYVCAAMSTDVVNKDGYEYRSYKYSASMAATIP